MTPDFKIQRSDLLYSITFRLCPRCKTPLKQETIKLEDFGSAIMVYMCHCKENKNAQP